MKNQEISWVAALEKEVRGVSMETLAAEGWVCEPELCTRLGLATSSLAYLLAKKVAAGEYEHCKHPVKYAGRRRALNFYRPVKNKPSLTRKKK